MVLTSLSPGVKRPERETDHSSPISAEVKKTWIYIVTPTYVLHGIVLNLLSTGAILLYFINRYWPGSNVTLASYWTKAGKVF
jgi:hypothetical protein